jgi:bacteriorhodopsin
MVGPEWIWVVVVVGVLVALVVAALRMARRR